MTRRMLGGTLLIVLLVAATLLVLWQLPRPVSAQTAIGVLWHRHSAELGPAWNRESCRNGVCAQDFRGGSIYSSATGSAYIVRNDAVGAAFDEFGGIGRLGPPIAAESGPDDRPWQAFVRGGIFANGDGQPVLVRGAVWTSWLQNQHVRGGLGFPRADQHRDRHGVVVQEFTNGAVYLRDGRPIPTVSNIASAHREAGAQFGPLGYPKGLQRPVGDRLVQDFDGGEVWWSAGTGAAAVTEPFLQEYRDRGGADGPFGLPLGESRRVGRGEMQVFQGGSLYRADRGGFLATTAGEIQSRYDELGGAEGELGLPVGEKTDIPDGRYQKFGGGVLLWHKGGGVVRLDTASFDLWIAAPARFGWPSKDVRTDDRGAHMDWEKSRTVMRDGRLYSVEPAALDRTTAVLICDSQCSGDSWIDQGARGAGFSGIVKRGYPGAGYVASSPSLGMGVVEGVSRNAVLLPDGDPGVVIVTLGGNDAARAIPAGVVSAALDELVTMLRHAYPTTPIVIDGVMSRGDPAHAARRAMDAVVTGEAQRLGCHAISVAGWVTQFSAPQADAVHLTAVGHSTIAPHYAEALKAALEP